jgi:hypothetical protein
MVLLFTGADAPDVPQINADKSLGGFISSSPIPNGRLGNLFSSISKNTVIKDTKEIRLIALKNTTGVIKSNINIYSVTTGKSIKMQLAAVAPATNSSSQLVFEQVYDSETLPYQATLATHEGSGNAIVIASMAVGETIGIWVYREIDQTKFPENDNATSNLSCQDLATLLKAQSASTEETVQLTITYT